MSEESHVDQTESCETAESKIVVYSTRLVARMIERALDVIYEDMNYMDPKIHEWRHSADKINIPIN